ncbi:MAG: hypothetical protein J6Y60_03170 [Treponema sp.]|nr:hypothetical protein [Treponema sp.]
MRARFLPIISFLCLAPLLLLSCTASVNENPQDSIDKIESEVYDSSSWDENSPISTEDSTGCLVFQSPSNPSEIELYFVLSIDLGGIEYSRTLQAEQTIIIKNVPLGHHTVTCKAYKSETGSLFARGSADAIFKYGQTAEMSLSLKKQLSPEAPVITVQPESKVLSLGEDGTCSTTIRAEARTSGGDLTAVWYKSPNADMSGKEALTGATTQTNSSEADPNLKICTTYVNFTLDGPTHMYYQCEFTHTDGENFGDEVSVTKTNIVSISVKALSSFTASYKGSPVRSLSLPSISDFTITETYSDGSTASGDTEDYIITTSSIDTNQKVGQIPIELKHEITGKTATANVSYKYQPQNYSAPTLDATSSITIAQYAGSKTLTVQGETPTSYTIYGSSPTQTVSDTVSYQWYKGTTPISGATDQRYTISADTAGTNSYSCKVTYTPNSTYALSTTATTKETPSVSVKVVPWTISVKKGDTTISSSEGRYSLDSGTQYTFYLYNADYNTLLALTSVGGTINWSEPGSSYLTINDGPDHNARYITPNASTSQNTSLELKYGQKTLCSAQISIKPESTPSDAITTWSGLKTAIEEYGSNLTEKTFTIAGDLDADSTISVTGNIKIIAYDASGATITRNSSYKNALFSVSGTNVILALGSADNNPITIDGNKDTVTAQKSLITVSDGAELQLNNNITLQNNKTSASGGAISADGATIRMSGGSIQGNNSTHSSNGGGGGGVYLENSSTMLIYGGTISGNETYNWGGGIFAKGSDTSITIEGSVSIMDNKTTMSNGSNPGGGGIYLYTNANLKIKSDGISIKNNTSKARGGGIYNTSSGNLTIYSTSLFTGNTAQEGGNHIYGYYKVGENGTEQTTLD